MVESQVFRDDVAYECRPAQEDPAGPLRCRRTRAMLEGPGAFTAEALAAFAADLSSDGDDLALSVEERTIAGADATCLVATPSGGRDPETLCLSVEGAQLLLDTNGQRLEASAYTTEVPAGTFSV